MKDQDYTLSVLKMVINSHLDSFVLISHKDLEILASKRDQVVWEVTTKIYTQSGHKVELDIVRDLIDYRISCIKNQLDSEQREREMVQREAQRVVEQRERENAQKESQRVADAKVAYQAALELFSRHKDLSQFQGDEIKAEIFIKTCLTIYEQLHVNANQINLGSSLCWDLNADELEVVQLVMAVEEKFDVEIPDEVAEEIRSVGDYVDYIYANQQNP